MPLTLVLYSTLGLVRMDPWNSLITSLAAKQCDSGSLRISASKELGGEEQRKSMCMQTTCHTGGRENETTE